jgi:hypothetical protein
MTKQSVFLSSMTKGSVFVGSMTKGSVFVCSMTRRLVFESWYSQEFSLVHIFQTWSGVHPTTYPMGTGAHSPRVKQEGHEADHSPPTTAEVKKTWIYTSTSPAQIVKDRDNFTFLLYCNVYYVVEQIFSIRHLWRQRDATHLDFAFSPWGKTQHNTIPKSEICSAFAISLMY